MLRISARDRVMVIAPHPDDEALAAGGVLQKTVAAGAKARVIFVTNGDDNPWPQRMVERRWKIKSEDRERWGARRREEARLAVERLGLAQSSARFLGFRDQEMTTLLLQAPEQPVTTFAALFDAWKP